MPSPSGSGATGGARGVRGARSARSVSGGSVSGGGGDGDGGDGGGDGGLNRAPGRYPPARGGKPRAKDAGATYTAGGAFNSGASAAGKRKGRWDDPEGGEGARRKLYGKGKGKAKGKGKGRLMVREQTG